MADEKQEEAALAEFEAKQPAQTGNKDVWLFLIIVDVVFLCVFGFFLYKNLSARLLAPADPTEIVAAVEEVAPAPEVEEVVEVAPAPAAEPQAPVVAPEPEKKAEPAQPAPQAEPAQPAEKKESILIKTNPKSKFRQVTFRYYGDGKKVAVVSGFTMAKPRALAKKNGYWETTLAIAPGSYKFLYVVDGEQITDPYSEQKDGRSVLVVK